MIWAECLNTLRHELSDNVFTMWIRPLHAEERDNALVLLAPNHYWTRYIQEHHLDQIRYLVNKASAGRISEVHIQVDSRPGEIISQAAEPANVAPTNEAINGEGRERKVAVEADSSKNPPVQKKRQLNPQFTFALFVEGRSNQMAAETCRRVLTQLGESQHNPLFLYGPTGLGKTHLMHAVGNALLQAKPNARVIYMTSENLYLLSVSSGRTYGSLSLC